MAVHAVFITLYFLSTFAVIIMVLERARSESERLHARLREVERLATAGELAAGMAHEIRNPLAAIVNATALLTDEAALTADERAATLAAVRTEARRLNRILSDFLHFARPQEARRTPGDIREVVQHVSALIRDDRSRAAARRRAGRRRPGGAALRLRPRPGHPGAVERRAQRRGGDERARPALARGGAAERRRRPRRERHRARHPRARACARVFEPFYSGKPNGSGLGLTIAERIVAAHGGRIEIDSEPGRGTRVTLLFPLEAA